MTGSRSEFGLLEPVLRAIGKRRGLEACLIVTGMHLIRRFGRTVDQIREAGWRIDATVRMQTGRDDVSAEPLALSRGISGMARALDELDCEIAVVLGDRIEAFAGACAAAAGRRVLVQIHAGDRAVGDMDDVYRDAISRLAHVHLAASREAVKRLIRMGERRSSIHCVGAPGLDDIRTLREKIAASPRRDQEHLRDVLGPVMDRPYAVVVQHAMGRSEHREASTMRHLLEAVERSKLHGVILYPNSDPGHTGIVAEIERKKGEPGWMVFASLPRRDYLQLVMGSAILVGNSSSGIIESASLGVNAVNVGQRQAGRLRCGSGVIDSAESLAAISRAIRLGLGRRRPSWRRSVYGDGTAGERIAELLQRLIIDENLLRKCLAY